MSYAETLGRSSIFGDVSRGVANPNIPYKHAYPTRFHGPIWTQPEAIPRYQPASYAVPPYAGLGCAGGCGCSKCGMGNVGPDGLGKLLGFGDGGQTDIDAPAQSGVVAAAQQVARNICFEKQWIWNETTKTCGARVAEAGLYPAVKNLVASMCRDKGWSWNDATGVCGAQQQAASLAMPIPPKDGSFDPSAFLPQPQEQRAEFSWGWALAAAAVVVGYSVYAYRNEERAK